ncbi:MAG TPA: site-2 protease family protein [Candidatus Paceibacterota bacterium]
MTIDVIFPIIILLLSVVFHEVSHGFVAYFLGDPTAKLAGRLTLNPLKHLDPIGSVLVPLLTYSAGGFIFGWAKPVPYNPYNLKAGRWGPALVGVAGPAANLLLAGFFAVLIRLGLSLPPAFLELAMFVVLINLILAVFNLLPLPPLDGAKILFACLPYRYRAVEEFVNRYQLILILLVLFFLWRLIFPLVLILFQLFTGLTF